MIKPNNEEGFIVHSFLHVTFNSLGARRSKGEAERPEAGCGVGDYRGEYCVEVV